MSLIASPVRPRESGDPGQKYSGPEIALWIPAFAGMNGEMVSPYKPDLV